MATNAHHLNARRTPHGPVLNAAEEGRQQSGRQTGKYKEVCVTDPYASMATNGRNRRQELADEAQMLMRWFKTDLENAASLAAYRR